MGDMNSGIHSYCQGFIVKQNAPEDFSLRLVREDGTDGGKILRRVGPTAQADLEYLRQVYTNVLLLQGADV